MRQYLFSPKTFFKPLYLSLPLAKFPQLQKQLKRDHSRHLFLFSSDPNFLYLTGLVNLSFGLLVVPSRKRPFLYLTHLDKEKKTPGIKKNILKKPFSLTLKQLKIRKLAYNSANLTLSQYRQLKKAFPKTQFKDYSSFLMELRKKKTNSEIYCLKKAAQLTSQAHSKIIQRLKKGKFDTEQDINFFLEQFAFKHRAGLSFPSIVASGANTCNPHHQTSNKKLSKGFLLLDFGLSYHHYCSDLTRLVYLGKPSSQEKERFSLLLKIQEEAIQSLKINQPFNGLDRVVRKNLGQYSSYFIHSLGHGVGVEVHEPPRISSDSKEKVCYGQVFTIEPGIYFKKYGLRLEDTILMKNKPTILTKAPKNLIVIKSKKYIK